MSDFERARGLFLAGVEAFEAGDAASAEREFLASLALLPGRASTLVNLAAVRNRLGRPAEALQALDAAALAEPASVDACCHRGQALALLGRHTEAAEAYGRALALDPDHAAAAWHHALQLNILGRHAPARQVLERLVARDPAHIPAWLLLGRTLQSLSLAQDALRVYDTVIGQAPEAAEAWTQRGAILKDLRRPAEAAESFRRALALGGDEEVNRWFLAAIDESAQTPLAPPRAYVEGLFDNYADDFDRHLVERLGYRTPELLGELLRRAQGPAAVSGAALDLGCGTGLMAPYLQPPAGNVNGPLDGVDLSARMLDKARATGRYRDLVQADVAEHLHATAGRYALVVAADVFVYVGALERVFAGVERVVMPGGLFGFSVEASDGPALQLRPSSRYAHSEGYVRELAAAGAWTVRAIERTTLRHDQRQPIEGLLVVLKKD